MSSERVGPKPEYFTHFEPDSMPDCYWQEMIEESKVFSPSVLAGIMIEAKEFLISAPGPNLARRRKLAPPWFNYWIDFFQAQSPLLSFREERGLVRSEKLKPFDQVRPYLERKHLVERSGALFVAGAEGHTGHVHAAHYMSKVRLREHPIYKGEFVSLFSVWAFEQDSYFSRKEKSGPFLSLEVRLSMWHHSPVNLLTVCPENLAGLPDAVHYRDLFDRLGVRYCFASEGDPYLEEKISRGDTNINRVIPHCWVAPTTERTMALGPSPERFSEKRRRFEEEENLIALVNSWSHQRRDIDDTLFLK